MNLMVKGFIFDFDGVLIDTNKYHFLSWQKTFENFNINFNVNIYNEVIGLNRSESLKYILNLSQENLNIKDEVILNKKNDFFLKLIKNLSLIDLMPGVKDFVLKYNSTHKIGVASSSKNARFILKKINFDHFFDIIVDGNDVTESKPNPKVFLKCAELLNLTPSECVVFEDSKNGIIGANKGGFHTYLVGESEFKNLAKSYIKDLTFYT